MRSFAKTLLAGLAILPAWAVVPLAEPSAINNIDIPGWLISSAVVRQLNGQQMVYLLVGHPGPIEEGSDEAMITEAWTGHEYSDEIVFFIGSEGAETVSRTLSHRSDREAEWEPGRALELYRLATGHTELELVADRLPKEIRALEAEGSELFLVSAGAIYRLVESRLERIIEHPTLAPEGVMPRSGRYISRADAQTLWLPKIGTFEMYSATGEVGSWEPSVIVPLRKQVRLGRTGLRLQSWPPLPCTPVTGEPMHFASFPEQVDKHRFRTEVYNLNASRGETRREVWSRFETPEKLHRAYFLALDGEPAVATWSGRADKLSLFSQPRLHLFRLEGDRTRAGKGAVLRVESLDEAGQRMLRPEVLDVDGDGSDDIQFLFSDKKHFRVRTYLQSINGRFDRKVRNSDVPLKGARKLRATGYANEDVTGDGLRDLVITAADQVLIYPGRKKTRDGRKLFEKTPVARLSLLPAGEAAEDSRILASSRVDLDGDGISELLFTYWLKKESKMRVRILHLN